MTFTLAEYLKLKQLEPGSEEAVHVGCQCTLEKKDKIKKYIIDPHCPFHWHMATQQGVMDLSQKIRETDSFNSALKAGYIVIAIGLGLIALFKF